MKNDNLQAYHKHITDTYDERSENHDKSRWHLIRADAEQPVLTDGSFDRIYCASAFFCILDPLATLRQWHGLLKSGGILSFHALPETSYYRVCEARKVFTRHGYPYLINNATGSIEKSEQLLAESGFDKIDIVLKNQVIMCPLNRQGIRG